MKICQTCGKEHDGSYGSGRFCCMQCSRKFSSSYNKEERIKKVRSTLLNKTLDEKRQSVLKGAETFAKNHPHIKRNFPQKRICKCCGKEYRYKKECDNLEICHFILTSKPKILQMFGFDFNKLGNSEVYDEYRKIKEILFKEYVIDKLSVEEIVEKRNSDENYLVWCLIKRMNIPIRSMKEANHNAILKGRDSAPKSNGYNYPYKCGWHTSWDNKQIYYRSSYELDFAKDLDSKKISYECETIRLPYLNTRLNEIKVAKSDFYVPEINTLYQIKSSWTYIKQDALDRYKLFTDHGYKVILVYEHKHYDDPNNYPEQSTQTIANLS